MRRHPLPQPVPGRMPPRRRRGDRAAIIGALAIVLLATPVVAALAGPGSTPSPLRSSLAAIAALTQRRLDPGTRDLAATLRPDAAEVGRLREPAADAGEQLAIALDELRRMNALTLDPHYLPALIATGRAFAAVSGQDPITRTLINPDYRGLEPELAAAAGRLTESAELAGRLRGDVRSLERRLTLARQRARDLEGRARRLRARTG